MPSYRVVVPIGTLRPGVTPLEVLPAVAEAVAAHADVEAKEVVLERGEPGARVRFGVTPTSRADEDRRARAAGRSAAEAAQLLAVTGITRLTRRCGQRWEPIFAGGGTGAGD